MNAHTPVLDRSNSPTSAALSPRQPCAVALRLRINFLPSLLQRIRIMAIHRLWIHDAIWVLEDPPIRTISNHRLLAETSILHLMVRPLIAVAMAVTVCLHFRPGLPLPHLRHPPAVLERTTGTLGRVGTPGMIPRVVLVTLLLTCHLHHHRGRRLAIANHTVIARVGRRRRRLT